MLQNIKDLQDNNITTVLTYSDKNNLAFNIFHNDYTMIHSDNTCTKLIIVPESTKIAYCVIHFVDYVSRKKLESPVFELYHSIDENCDDDDDEEFMQSEIFEELQQVTDFLLELI